MHWQTSLDTRDFVPCGCTGILTMILVVSFESNVYLCTHVLSVYTCLSMYTCVSIRQGCISYSSIGQDFLPVSQNFDCLTSWNCILRVRGLFESCSNAFPIFPLVTIQSSGNTYDSGMQSNWPLLRSFKQ